MSEQYCNKIPYRVIIIWIILLFICYNFSPDPSNGSVPIYVPPTQLMDAVVFIAMGDIVTNPSVDFSIASVRKLGKWKGDIYLLTDSPDCFTQAEHFYRVNIIEMEPVKTIMEIKSLKAKLFQYLPSTVNGILYVDIDILVTRNLMPFFRDLGSIIYSHQAIQRDVKTLTSLTTTENPKYQNPNNTIFTPSNQFNFQNKFSFGAFLDARGHYVGFCSGCEKWHTGVMWFRRNLGKKCLKTWEKVILSGKFNTDQESLDFVEKNGSCPNAIDFPTRHLLFAKDYIGMVLTSGQTFIHLTDTSHDNKKGTGSKDFFYHNVVAPRIRQSLHPPLNPNKLNHEKKCTKRVI